MSDTEIIQAILNGGEKESNAFQYLYYDQKFRSKAEKTVRKYQKLRLEKWEDIFHDGLIKLATNIKLGKYRSDSEMVNYFGGICKNLCREKIRKENKEAEFPELGLPPEKVEDLQTPLDLMYSEDLKNTLRDAIQQTGDNCREILKNWALSFSSVEIAEKQGLKNEQTARTYVNRCKTKLREYLRNNPGLLKILKDLRWL